MDYQSISRFVFLLLIVGLSVYFITVNKNHKERETFFQQPQAPNTQNPTPKVPTSVPESNSNTDNLSDNTDAVNKDIIRSIYQELFKKDPVDDEINFYLDYIKSRNITKQQLKDVIETTAPILRKTIPESTLSAGKLYGTEDEVILAYNQILDRNPDAEELRTYAAKMNNDKTFTMDKLVQLLVASDEYVRLAKMQSNNANGSLLGGVTDRQITLTVDATFTDITGKQADPDTIKFLKKKFVEFNLDEKKLQSFIKNYMSNSPACSADSSTNASRKEYDLVLQEQVKKLDAAATAASNKAPSTNKQGTTIVKKEPFTTAEDGTIVYNNSQVYNVIVPPNQDMINSLLQSMNKESDYYVDSQSVIDTINKKSQCVFNKNIGKQKDETLLSDEINNRNMQELQSACARNTAFLNSDSEFVLRPDQKWKVPEKKPPVCSPASKCQVVDSTDQSSLIGTLLTDANKTSIGSILPYHPPR